MNDIDWLSCRRIERMRDAEDVLDVLCEKFGNESRLALVRIFHSATAPRAKEQANLTEKADV